MNRLFVIAGALALGAIVTGTAVRADDKEISIKEIMTKAHKGADSVISKARAAAKSKDFDDLSKEAKTLVKLGDELSKAKPDKGDEKSWKKLTGTYVKTTKVLETAAKGKDADGAAKALKAIGGSCAGCHKAHK